MSSNTLTPVHAPREAPSAAQTATRSPGARDPVAAEEPARRYPSPQSPHHPSPAAAALALSPAPPAKQLHSAPPAALTPSPVPLRHHPSAPPASLPMKVLPPTPCMSPGLAKESLLRTDMCMKVAQENPSWSCLQERFCEPATRGILPAGLDADFSLICSAASEGRRAQIEICKSFPAGESLLPNYLTFNAAAIAKIGEMCYAFPSDT